MKTGPKFVIDHTVLFQMTSDKMFYAALPPACSELVDKGKAAYKEAVDSALGDTCVGCSSLTKVMTPFQTLLGTKLAAIQEANPELLKPLIDYFAGKRGYRPDPIMLYYKQNGRVLSLKL